MRRNTLGWLVCVGLALGLPGPAGAQRAGLWVGEVRIEGVSRSNAPREDLAFDLKLTGITESTAGGQTLETPAVVLGARDNWSHRQEAAVEPADDTQGRAWTALDYSEGDVPGWSVGPGAFGFGPGGDAGGFGTGPPDVDPTPVSLAPDEPDRAAPLYLRNVFTVPKTCSAGSEPPGTACSENVDCGRGGVCTTASFDRIEVAAVIDDGAVLYLNGTEIARVNLAEGTGSAPSLRPLGPVSGSAAAFLTEIELLPGIDLPSILVEDGTNVLAVSLHQYEYAEANVLTEVAPVDPPFDFRLLVHLDAEVAPRARLLKEVIQMRDPTTQLPALLVDDTLIPSFDPMTLVDGRPVGFRVSSAAFDYAGAPPAFTGSGASFGDGGATFTVTLVDPYDGATNPFRHGFHPDHDNLDSAADPGEETLAEGVESFEVTREITLEFTASDPDLATLEAPEDHLDPAWGSDLVGGIYRETLTGLHRNPIQVVGTFRLRRVDETETLEGASP